MEPEQFERIAREALEALPEHLQQAMADVIVTIVDTSRDHPGARGRSLLGLYEGVPLTEWGRDYNGKIPDRITLFRIPIMEQAGTEEMIPTVIRETVWHEVAHFFGFDHDVIRKMERRWREQRKGTGQP